MAKKKKKVVLENEKEMIVKPAQQVNLYKALTEQVVGMGYSYSMANLLKTMIFFGFIIVVLSYFHELKFYYIGILVAVFMVMLPFSIYSQYKYLYEQKRFNQLKTYLKFMRLNFKQYKKIKVALRETLDNFSEDEEIYGYIVEALNSINAGNDFRRSMDIIEEPFKNSYITKLHAYMILSETEGGEAAFDALDSIDFEAWESDTYIFQTQKYKFQNQNALFTLFGLALSLYVIGIFKDMMADDTVRNFMGDMFADVTFQLVTFIYILIDMVSFISIKGLITGKWVRDDE